MRRLFSSLRPRAIALACINIYVSATVVSVMVAHVLVIAKPESGLAQRMISPVAKGLEFLDAHWKSVLILPMVVRLFLLIKGWLFSNALRAPALTPDLASIQLPW